MSDPSKPFYVFPLAICPVCHNPAYACTDLSHWKPANQPVHPQPQMWSSMHTNLFCANADAEYARRQAEKAKWHAPKPIREWSTRALLNLRKCLQ